MWKLQYNLKFPTFHYKPRNLETKAMSTVPDVYLRTLEMCQSAEITPILF